MEQRIFPLTVMVHREATNSAGRFIGHAAVFSQRTEIGDAKRFGWHEQISPSAFNRALDEEQDVRMLVDHDTGKVVARTKSGTLVLRRDKAGLAVDANVADTTVGRDLVTLVDRGDMSGMSFGFMVRGDKWEQLDDGTELRTITDVDLFEVSAVAFPAYPQTDASLRSARFDDGTSDLMTRRALERRAEAASRLPARTPGT